MSEISGPLRQAEEALAVAIARMPKASRNRRWVAYWDHYTKAVKLMLRLRDLAERVERVEGLRRNHVR